MRNARLELTPLLLDSLYTEAVLLVDDVRACFDRSIGAGHLSPEISVAFSCESLKVSTRLMHSIAWLLNQKALGAGEITRDEAQNEAKNLGYAPASDGPLVLQFPLEAQALIGASEELYSRLKRLSEKMRAPVPQVSEPHAMRDRLRASF
jgi:regulator of CtrA degradation